VDTRTKGALIIAVKGTLIIAAATVAAAALFIYFVPLQSCVARVMASPEKSYACYR
jgi:hypothetical protein